MAKIKYEKPQLISLSDNNATFGSTSCHSNGASASDCQNVGSQAAQNCNNGENAGMQCKPYGHSATSKCDTGGNLGSS